MISDRASKHQTEGKKKVTKKATSAKTVDRLIYFAAIVEPLFSVPQAYAIFSTRSAESVSIVSWLGFELMTLIWLWYGIVHRDKMILIYQGLFFVIDGSVVIGALLYGGSF